MIGGFAIWMTRVVGAPAVSGMPRSCTTTTIARRGGRYGVARFVSLPYCYLVPYGCWCCCAMARMLETYLHCCYQAFPWYSHYHNPWEGARFLGVIAAISPITICQAVVWGVSLQLLCHYHLWGYGLSHKSQRARAGGSIPVLPLPLILPPLYVPVYPLSDVNV